MSPPRRAYPRRGLSGEDWTEDDYAEADDPIERNPRSKLPRFIAGSRNPPFAATPLPERSNESTSYGSRATTPSTERRIPPKDDASMYRNSPSSSVSRIPRLVNSRQPHTRQLSKDAPSFSHDSSRFIATPSPALDGPDLQDEGRLRYDASYYDPPFLSPMINNQGYTNTYRSPGSNQPLPSSWGSAPQGYLGGQGSLSIDDETEDGQSYTTGIQGDSVSYAPTLARQASVTKFSKPTMTNIRAPIPQTPEESWLASVDTFPQPQRNMTSQSYLDSTDTNSTYPVRNQSKGNNFLDSSTEPSVTPVGLAMPAPQRGKPQKSAFFAEGRRSPRPFHPSTLNSRHNKLLGMDVPSGPLPTSPVPMAAPPNPIARPPRVMTQPPTVRGSTTSLPELIRRATKLAANLEHGRTASRTGRPPSRLRSLMVMADPIPEEEYMAKPKTSDELSDMLAAFPPPINSKRLPPRRFSDGSSDNPSRWKLLNENRMSKPHRRRQATCCCGIPRWAVIILVLIALVIIAIAIAVPLQVVVLKKKGTVTTTSTPQNPTATTCNLTCANGGTVEDSPCRCACSVGYIGETCEEVGNSGCQMGYPASATFQNASVGDAIPRVLEFAQTTFNIPLDPNAILLAFAENNMSCILENAFVKFNGVAIPTTRKRFIAEVRPREFVTLTVRPGATTTATNSAPSSTSTAVFPEVKIDFSRAVVLFILQISGATLATTTQASLQGYMMLDDPPNVVSISNYYEIDFGALTVKTQNGTVVGGKGTG